MWRTVAGVIGGGIAGTSAAYYLRQLFGKKAQVDVIEGVRVGGRLALINIDGKDYEAGGTIIHPKNAYMLNFTQQFGKH
jgi:prenylcysteine oxidase/farnesylcysteine lyase